MCVTDHKPELLCFPLLSLHPTVQRQVNRKQCTQRLTVAIWAVSWNDAQKWSSGDWVKKKTNKIWTPVPSPFPPQVIRGLLKFWPKTCSQKEVCLVVSQCSSWTLCNLCVCVVTLLSPHLCAGNVSRGAGGNSGCHRTNTVRQDPGASIQTDLQMCVQPTLPGQCLSN